ARRKDAECRRQGEADRLLSLYSFGFELDERIDERLQDLKRSGRSPQEALPDLTGSIERVWDRGWFLDWVKGHGDVESTTTSLGRRIKGTMPQSLGEKSRKLVGALAPLADAYPLPHFMRGA
ncbi:MAG: BREX-6 system BrxE protein, partial [Vicinamibacterales bacterium]